MYGIGTVVLRAVNFVLLPVYTRYLTPTDYGTVALVVTVTSVLGIVYPLGLHGAVTRFYFSSDDPHHRRRLIGTFWLAITAAAFVLALTLDRWGGPLFARLFPTIPFSPLIRLGIWTAFFNVFGLVPLAVLQAEERAATYVTASFVSAVLTAGATLLLVVGYRMGGFGYLLGTLAGAVLSSVIYIGLSVRVMTLRPHWSGLLTGLAFALPLIPHGLASWVLDLSDRMLLGHYVPPASLGLYAIAVQFGAILGILATAINSAWIPYVYRRVAEDPEASDAFVRIVTVFAGVLSVSALWLALVGPDIIRWLTSPGFYAAATLLPWIVAGYWCAGLYYAPCAFLFVSDQTKYVPVVTIVAGAINVAANIILMPRFGVVAAAWTTFGSYFCMLVLAWGFAQRVYPVRYAYSEIFAIAGGAVAIFTISRHLTPTGTLAAPLLRIGLSVVFTVVTALWLLRRGPIIRSEVSA